MAQDRSEQGYGRKWPKYVLIYLAVAAVVYGLIYVFFFTDGGSGGLYGGI
jgi:hypothetical protein